MSDLKQTSLIFVSTLAISALGLSLVAQAQNSPFAKKGKQTWEQDQSITTSPTYTSRTYSSQQIASPDTSITTQANTTNNQMVGHLPQAGTSAASKTNYPSSYNYQLPSSNAGNVTISPTTTQNVNQGLPYPNNNKVPSYNYDTNVSVSQPSQASGSYQAGSSYDYPNYNSYSSQSSQKTNSPQPAQNSNTYYPGRVQSNNSSYVDPTVSQYGSPVVQSSQSPFAPTRPSTGGQQGYQYNYQAPTQKPKRSFKEKLGLNNLDYHYEGYLRAGGAGTYQDVMSAGDSWREDFIFDGSIRGEISAITPGGLEYGIAGEVRGQYDQYRRGFGGRVGDCPASNPNCPSVNIAGTDYELRGHTSRFYADGVSDTKDFEAQLESAHIFLRSAYGDVTVGRDDGAAYLFSLGAPSLMNVGASNNSVDYTGLDSVKTLNDASGFAEKVTYTSPRLLGDQIGLGVQFGASYAFDAKACGVDYCVRDNSDEPTGVLAPDLEDVMEFGVALDRKFDNGLSVEVTGTYARASEQSGFNVFDDLESYGLALELGYGDFIVGGSYLKSNNGLIEGDYQAMDVGLTWQPSKFGVTLGYGHATDDNVGLTSDQAIVGLSYDWRENIRFGTGVQYVNRDVNVADQTTFIVSGQNEDATSVFIEGRFTF